MKIIRIISGFYICPFEDNIIFYSFILLLLFLIFLLLVFLKSKNKLRQANILLEEKNKEITAQKEEIQRQKDHITQKTMDLMVLNKELKENDELRKGLTGMIVHDLKNPVSNIIKLTDNREVAFFARQMLTMVENILDIQKYEGIIMPLNIKDIKLSETINEAISDIFIFSEYKNISIINKISPKIKVKADKEILKRIFVNLLSNAIKYTDKNGKITIENESCPDEPNKIKIKVTDNGIGISKEKIPLIFNKFSQIIAKNTGEARSTGIGLTFCKMAVEAHESSITVVSEPGKYTSFEFCLPVANTVEKEYTEANKEYVFKKNCFLDKNDKKYLSEFYPEFNKFEVFEIGELRKVIKQIDETFSENVKNWKEQMNFAVYHCNQKIYNNLKDAIKK